MSRYELAIKGTNYTVEINGLTGSSCSVTVNGTPYQVEIRGGVAAKAVPVPQSAPAPVQPQPKPVQAAAPATQDAPAEGEVILAPMPGHIISVAVKAGEHIDPGTTVVVMEAMKMENDIKSHISGTVKEVRVSAGQDVSVNEILVVIGG